MFKKEKTLKASLKCSKAEFYFEVPSVFGNQRMRKTSAVAVYAITAPLLTKTCSVSTVDGTFTQAGAVKLSRYLTPILPSQR